MLSGRRRAVAVKEKEEGRLLSEGRRIVAVREKGEEGLFAIREENVDGRFCQG